MLVNEVKDAFEDLYVPFDGDDEKFWDVPLEELVKLNQRALILFEDAEAVERNAPFLWPSAFLENTFANTDDFEKMNEFNYDRMRAFNAGDAPREPMKLSWTLTTQTSTIERSIWPLVNNHHPKTLIDLALKKANPNLPEFAKLVEAMRCVFPQVFVVNAWLKESDNEDDEKSNNEYYYWELATHLALRGKKFHDEGARCRALLSDVV